MSKKKKSFKAIPKPEAAEVPDQDRPSQDELAFSQALAEKGKTLPQPGPDPESLLNARGSIGATTSPSTTQSGQGDEKGLAGDGCQKLVCHVCGARYKTELVLTRHLERVHLIGRKALISSRG